MLSKEQLRKFHGIPDPTSQPDQKVLSRRRSHEMAAKWLAKWSLRLQVIFSMVGVVVVLLPTLSKFLRAIVNEIPVAAKVFHDFSTLSGFALINLFVLAFLFVVRGVAAKHIPGARPPALTYRDVVDMEIYPMTKKEEFAYWADIAYGIAGTSLWLFLPFGILAYFIRMGA